jgi:Protein of unknown function (DUF992)
MRSQYLRRYLLLATLAAAALGLGSRADAQTWVQAGMLKCRLNPSIGFVIFGHQSMECSFHPVSGPVQTYEGAINTVGLDLGFTEGGVLAWGVFGPASGMPYGALAGEYVGASGDVGFGPGVGANSNCAPSGCRWLGLISWFTASYEAILELRFRILNLMIDARVVMVETPEAVPLQ